MSAENFDSHPDTCGCCGTPLAEPGHTNRPGQSALAYRIGTHSTFLQRMLALLPKQAIPDGDNAGTRPLAALATRSVEDPAIAFLDALATAADVLTFYQERIANEGFLRTATERRSVLELARAIGYELNPGVAAGTYLAFTVDDAPGASTTAAIPQGTQVQSIPAARGELPQTFETMEEFEAHAAWNALKPRTTQEDVIEVGKTEVYLRGVSTQLQPGDAILIVGQERESDPSSARRDVRLVQTVETNSAGNYTRVMWDEGLSQPAASATAKVYIFRQRAAIFGYNAPDWRAMSNDIKLSYGASTDTTTGNITTTEWPNFSLADEIDTENPQIHLDLVYPKILAGSWVVLSQPAYTELYRAMAVVQSARTDFTLTARTTLITLDTAGNLTAQFNDRRATVVYTQSEELERAEKPRTTPVEGNTIALEGLVEGLGSGQAIIVSGKLSETDEHETSEVAFVDFTTEDGSRTTISLENGLEHSYVRATVTIYANVVRATHGETTQEVLGSGNGAMTNQHFTLKKSPLTYVSAATASGSESTLEVRGNEVQWTQVSSLYSQPAAGKDSQVYSVRINDDGVSSVIFGDGKSGARLPTGQENIQTTYRVGLGTAGEMGTHRLTLLKTRPFGVRSVTNPVAASGAADPETLDAARTNAPMTVLTLDRVVSLQDFEDFARAFAGIGKAQAVNTWNGETFLVHISIADANGDQVPATSDLLANLRSAMDAARDPTARVVIASFEPLRFNLVATVMYDAAYLAEAVQARVEVALQDTFSFARREFGQPVTAAEVISVIQQIEGVVAVDLDALYVSTENPGLASVLPARTARRENGTILPAQLMLLNELGIGVTMRAV